MKARPTDKPLKYVQFFQYDEAQSTLRLKYTCDAQKTQIYAKAITNNTNRIACTNFE